MAYMSIGAACEGLGSCALSQYTIASTSRKGNPKKRDQRWLERQSKHSFMGNYWRNSSMIHGGIKLIKRLETFLVGWNLVEWIQIHFLSVLRKKCISRRKQKLRCFQFFGSQIWRRNDVYEILLIIILHMHVSWLKYSKKALQRKCNYIERHWSLSFELGNFSWRSLPLFTLIKL